MRLAMLSLYLTFAAMFATALSGLFLSCSALRGHAEVSVQKTTAR